MIQKPWRFKSEVSESIIYQENTLRITNIKKLHAELVWNKKTLDRKA
jgi:hypothetical protein